MVQLRPHDREQHIHPQLNHGLAGHVHPLVFILQKLEDDPLVIAHLFVQSFGAVIGIVLIKHPCQTGGKAWANGIMKSHCIEEA